MFLLCLVVDIWECFYYWGRAHVYMCVVFIVWGEVLFRNLCVSLSLFVSCFAFLHSLLCFMFSFFCFAAVVAP